MSPSNYTKLQATAHKYKHLRLCIWRLGIGDRLPDILQQADSSLQNLESHRTQQGFLIFLVKALAQVSDYIPSDLRLGGDGARNRCWLVTGAFLRRPIYRLQPPRS